MNKHPQRKGSDSPLERLRERVGLTQEKLCRRCGIPLRTYARWVAGDGVSRPNIPQIKALCRELGISIEELPDDFGSSERSPNPEQRLKTGVGVGQAGKRIFPRLKLPELTEIT